MLLLGSKFGRNFDETSTHTMYTHFKLRPNCDPSRNTYLKLRPNDPTIFQPNFHSQVQPVFRAGFHAQQPSWLVLGACLSFTLEFGRRAPCAQTFAKRVVKPQSLQELLSSHKALHFCERFHVSLLHALSRGRLCARVHALCTIPVCVTQ